MPKKSRILALLFVVPLALTGWGCSSRADLAPQDPSARMSLEAVHLINPIGPAVIPVAGIASGEVVGDVDIDVQYWKTVDEAVGLLSGDGVEFAVLPVTTGVNLYASGIDIALLAVHEWKVFYLIASNSSDFTGWSSLVGTTIYTPEAKGQTVDVLTRYALSKENIIPDKDVAFAYAPAQEIVALFKEGKIAFAALPEPFVTQALAVNNGKIVLDYQDYWSEVSGSQKGIPIAGLFVKQDFYSNHPDVVQEVARVFAESTEWANEHPDTAILASSDALPLPSEMLKEALQRIQFEYVPAPEAKEDIMIFLSAMQETYPEGIKQIPDEAFFQQ